MRDFEKELSSIKAHISRVQQQKAVQEAKKAQAAEEIKETAKKLKEEFGISSLSEAKSLLEQKRLAIEARISEIKEALEEIDNA